MCDLLSANSPPLSMGVPHLLLPGFSVPGFESVQTREWTFPYSPTPPHALKCPLEAGQRHQASEQPGAPSTGAALWSCRIWEVLTSGLWPQCSGQRDVTRQRKMSSQWGWGRLLNWAFLPQASSLFSSSSCCCSSRSSSFSSSYPPFPLLLGLELGLGRVLFPKPSPTGQAGEGSSSTLSPNFPRFQAVLG